MPPAHSSTHEDSSVHDPRKKIFMPQHIIPRSSQSLVRVIVLPDPLEDILGREMPQHRIASPCILFSGHQAADLQEVLIPAIAVDHAAHRADADAAVTGVIGMILLRSAPHQNLSFSLAERSHSVNSHGDPGRRFRNAGSRQFHGRKKQRSLPSRSRSLLFRPHGFSRSHPCPRIPPAAPPGRQSAPQRDHTSSPHAPACAQGSRKCSGICRPASLLPPNR